MNDYDFETRIIERFREINESILSTISSGVIVLDPSGLIVMVNKYASTLLSFSENSVGMLFQNVLSEDITAIVKKLIHNLGNHSESSKLKIEDKWIYLSVLSLTDSQKQQMGILLLFQDITVQEETSVQLYRAERLSSLGTMLSGINHELRNPLSVISARCKMASMNRDRDLEWYKKAMESIENQCERCTNIINGLLDFVGSKSGISENVSIEEILEEALGYAMYHVTNDKVEVKRCIDSALTVFGDKSRYIQVFLNLMINAIDAMGSNGTLSISASKDSGSFVTICIADTGTGISSFIQEKIFDPFFTTKEPGKGTGLGLSIVYTIIRESGGKIACKSVPGETVFTVSLPSGVSS